MEQAVTEAVRILREGGVILYPTDTVWGIGCDATNAEAVERIYHLKRSENKKSMLVLCATPDMVVRYVHKAPGIAFEVQELATKPLTSTRRLWLRWRERRRPRCPDGRSASG